MGFSELSCSQASTSALDTGDVSISSRDMEDLMEDVGDSSLSDLEEKAVWLWLPRFCSEQHLRRQDLSQSRAAWR